jgi:hypothetical protein
MNTKAGGEEGRIHPLSVWRGVSKKNVIHQADFLAGILRCSARELFEHLMCFFSVFLYFCDITMFRAKKDSSYKHPDFYDNPIHPSPLPRAYNNFTAKRPHEEKTPRTNSRKKL